MIAVASIHFEHYTIELFFDFYKGNDLINNHKGVINVLINFSCEKFYARHLKNTYGTI